MSRDLATASVAAQIIHSMIQCQSPIVIFVNTSVSESVIAELV